VGRIGLGVRVSTSFQKNPRQVLSYGSKKRSYDLGEGACPEGVDLVSVLNPRRSDILLYVLSC